MMSKDPRDIYPKPPFPKQELDFPGDESKMDPKPDYGEKSYKGCGKLKGKTALITGGDSGIGRAVALALAREGAGVAISYLDENRDALETMRAVKESGGRGEAFGGDIQEPKTCKTIVGRVVEYFGGVDIVINNAAYQMSYDKIEDIPPEEIEKTFRVNLFAMFYFVQAALPHLKPGSSIINTTSIQSYMPSPELMPYAASKAAITNFTKSLAEQLGQRGIRVNAVAPGPVWTPLIPSSMPQDKVTNFGKDDLFGRPAQPAELAPVYVFLASDEASYVTGHVYGVTGGRGFP